MSTTQGNPKLKPIWVIETINKPLKKLHEAADGQSEEDKYTFTGPCADFTGEKNENERVYDKDDYGSHVEYLQEEISDNSLLGELNHNEDYMVDMTKVSHMITKLAWDDSSKCYLITIKLLDTDNGKNAKAIADGGAPLYISSRASGYIDEQGNVTLERIYTYDIVYRPGFKIAKLKRLNESLGIKSKSIEIYERDASATINNNNKFNKDMNDVLKKSEFEEYTQKLGKHMDSLNETIKGLKSQINEGKSSKTNVLKHGKTDFAKPLNESLTVDDIKTHLIDKPLEKVKELYKKYVAINIPDDADIKALIYDIASAVLGDPKKSAELLQEVKTNEADDAGISFADDKDKMADFGSLEMADFLAKYPDVTEADYNATKEATKSASTDNTEFEAKLDEVVASLEGMKLEVAGIMEYAELLKNRVNGQGAFMKTVSEFSNRMADFTDLISKRVNDQGDFMNLIANRVNEVNDYSEKVAAHSNETAKYSENNAKQLNKVIESQNSTIKIVNEMKKSVNESISKRVLSYITSQKLNETKNVKEKDIKNIVGEKGALTTSVNTLIESVKKKGTDKNQIIMEHSYPFVKHLNAEVKTIFESMNEVQRKQISEIVKKDNTITKDNISDVVKRVNEDKDLMRLLHKMPKKFIKAWESASVKEQQQIVGLYRLKNCTSDLDLEMFWEGIDLQGNNEQVNENLNESITPMLKVGASELGYNVDEIDRSLGLS